MALTRIQKSIVRKIRELHSQREPLNITAVKRNHPELIERVYAVRPFWGWKSALADAGLSYNEINTELLDYVDCKICGKDFGALDIHLMRKHDTTAEDYRSEYPGAETTCERLRATIAENRLHKTLPLPRWEVVWTPEYVLDRIAEMHRRDFPINLDWVTSHDQGLSVKAREYFGSWDEALRRVGLDPEKIRLARPTEHLTKKELIARLTKLHSGRSARHRWPGSKDESALANAARKYFGTWNKALRAAGIEPLKETSQWATAPKRAVVAEIRRRKRTGESLGSVAAVGKKWERALRLRAEKLFGTWNRALRAARIEPRKEDSPLRHAGKAAIIAEIRRRHRAGEPLETTKVEREKWGSPLMNRCRILFGSWPEALLAAGVDLPAGLASPWRTANKSQIISEIRRRKRVRETLLISQIEKEPWGAPLAQRTRRLFGSWGGALLAAGLETEARATMSSPWSGANSPAILREIRRRHRAGKSVRYTDITQERWGRPLIRRATELFGTWTNALRAVNVEPIKANSPWPRATKNVVLSEIRRRSKTGLSLASKRVSKERWGKPLVRRATELFGSWTQALLTAGLRGSDLPERKRWSQSDRSIVLEEIRRRRRTRQSLRTTDLEKGGGRPLLNRSRKLFGSWKAAIRAAR